MTDHKDLFTMSDIFARLDGKSAVVTGSSSGIGEAIAVQLATAGAHVLMHCSRPRASVDQKVIELRNRGLNVDLLAADFQSSESTHAFATELERRLPDLDILVNNAGVDLLTGAGRDWDYGQKLQKLFDIDVRSTAILCRRIGRQMVDSGGGVIINIGWDQSDRGMEGDSGELFAAAKNSIMGLTRSVSLSLAPAVRVNCVAPGWIRTAWGDQASEVWQQRVLSETPMKRWGEPEDIAHVVRFLCSDEASFVSGQIWNVNGGAVR